MDSKIEGIHSLARHYCIERYSYWANIYSTLASQGKERKSNGYHYTDNALDIFPRYQVLNAILVDLERFTPERFKSLEEARDLICLAGQTAESLFTQSPFSEIQKRAMDEERAAFCNYISTLNETELESAPPLFYRRVLSADESREMWSRVKETWDIKDKWYWYPLIEGSRDDVLAVQDKYFYEEVGTEKLREILSGHGVEKVFELRENENGPDYEMELSIAEFSYNGLEGYWCCKQMDWLIYASHESSISFGGTWLIDELKNIWRNWAERIWDSPFFE